MPKEDFDVCIDAYLPLEQQAKAKETALRVNPANALEVTEEGLVDSQGQISYNDRQTLATGVNHTNSFFGWR